jgi:hypothetical protein
MAVAGKVLDSDEEGIAAPPAILSYDRRAWCADDLKRDSPTQEWPETISALIISC